MIPKPLDAISKTDIDALVENKVSEGRTIEYKKCLPGGTDDDKKEFLADISSFANAAGGDLLYGVSAVDGVPQDASGLVDKMDSELLKLENLVRVGLDPRIPGIRMQPVNGFAKGPILLIRVPRSWAAPHMVKLGKSTRFFTRNSAGKHQMDVTEIRASFLLSEALPEKMKRFRDERLGRIVAGETPVPLYDGAKLILHILPVASFMGESNFDISFLAEHGKNKLRPIGGGGWNNRYNLDGFVTYDGEVAGSYAYSQIFREGKIESVYADLVRERDGEKLIPSTAYEERIIEGVLTYIDLLKSLGVSSPAILFISMTGVRNVLLGVNTFYFSHRGYPIDRDTLTLPDIMVEEYETLSNFNAVAKLLRPAFDSVWNACGFEHSHNFDKEGNWKKS